MTVPEHFEARLQEVRHAMPTDSMRDLGTAVVGLFVALPRDVQLSLFAWAHSVSLNPHRGDPADALSIVMRQFDDAIRERIQTHVSDMMEAMQPGTPLEDAKRTVLRLIRPPRQRPDGHWEQDVIYPTRPIDQDDAGASSQTG